TVPVRRGYQRVTHQRPSRMSKKKTCTIARRNHQEIRKKRRRRWIFSTGGWRGGGGSTLVVAFVTVCTRAIIPPHSTAQAQYIAIAWWCYNRAGPGRTSQAAGRNRRE